MGTAGALSRNARGGGNGGGRIRSRSKLTRLLLQQKLFLTLYLVMFTLCCPTRLGNNVRLFAHAAASTSASSSPAAASVSPSQPLGGGDPSSVAVAAVAVAPTGTEVASTSAEGESASSLITASPLSSLTSIHHRLANLRQRALPAVLLLAGLYLLVKKFAEGGLQVLLLALTPALYNEAVSVVVAPTEVAAETVGVVNPSPPMDLLNAPNTTSNTASSSAAGITDDETGAAISEVAACKQNKIMYYSNRWWWFLSYSLLLTLPSFFSSSSDNNNSYLSAATAAVKAKVLPAQLQLAGFNMVLFGWMAWIVNLNRCPSQRSNGGDAVDMDVDEKESKHFQRAWREVTIYHMGILMTLVPVTCWIKALQITPGGKEWALYAALLVILNDTAAYLVGFFFGKHPLLPVISPKKTLEGWSGALVLTILLSYRVWKILFDVENSPYSLHSFNLALFCSVVAPLGGFLASSIKRAYNRKDFGNLIVGHGGLIDRLDCQLLTAPYLYLYLKATGATNQE